MSAIHVHLLTNHAPLFFTLFSTVLLLAGTVLRSRDLTAAAFITAIFTALTAGVVVATGHAAADAIGKVGGIDQNAIGPHEAAATRFLVSAIAAGALALAAIMLRHSRVSRAVHIAAAVAITLSFVLAGIASAQGGKIRHTEITRTTNASACE